MSSTFDPEEAKKNLQFKESEKKHQNELTRTQVLAKTISILKEKFQNSSVEVYLVGSITRPFAFSSQSDVDIVLKHFQGDRFTLWPELEDLIGRPVEIILFESCHFQEFVEKEGVKVV